MAAPSSIDINGITANLNPTANVAGMVDTGPHASDPYSGALASEAPAQGLLHDNSSFNQSLGGNEGAMTGAIQQRYMGGYNIAKNQLDINVAKEARQDKLNHLMTVSSLANQEVMQNRQKAIIAYQIDQANKRARGQILGSVLGITGGIVGGVVGAYAGGPAGAAAGASAGYNLGSGAGQAIGQGG